MTKNSLIMLTMVLAACGGGEVGEGEGDGKGAGFTECGDTTCQPGQYCFDQHTGTCQNGCTSDANCEEGHACVDIDAGSGEGTCSEGSVSGEGEGEQPDGSLEGCTAACDRFADCGMQGDDYNDCLNLCPDLSQNQRATVARCAEGSCSDSMNCLDIECFNDDDCGGGNCVGGNCM